MPSRVLHTPADAMEWLGYLSQQSFPMTVSHTEGEKRSNPQNRTIHMWYGEAAKKLGDTTAEDVRAECKLQFGVPILRRDDAAFLLEYDATFKPLPYEMKRKIFKALDPAITSRMTVKQLTEYMDAMRKHFAEGGVYLSDPELRKYEGARA